jgi:hypothetical protein
MIACVQELAAVACVPDGCRDGLSSSDVASSRKCYMCCFPLPMMLHGIIASWACALQRKGLFLWREHLSVVLVCMLVY